MLVVELVVDLVVELVVGHLPQAFVLSLPFRLALSSQQAVDPLKYQSYQAVLAAVFPVWLRLLVLAGPELRLEFEIEPSN